MKIYVIVGLDRDGNIDSQGAFASKSDAYNAYFNNPTQLAKAVVLPVTIKEISNATSETGGSLRPPGESVATTI